METKSLADIQEKWGRVTPQRADDYARGVTNPKKDWAKNTVAAKANYDAGVKAAMERNAFSKGVTNAGTETWQAGAISKGVDRFGPGVAASVGKYAENVAPYIQTLQSTSLPARGPKGSDANYNRSRKVGEALHAKKLSIA